MKGNIAQLMQQAQRMQENMQRAQEDLVAAAFNDAVNKVNAESQAKMAAATAGMPMPPGMKLPF